jgi:type I restriction enzyme S subunit
MGVGQKIPEGYKQTEVGVIPEDWEERSLGEVSNYINGRGFKPHEWSNQGYPIIRIQNLNGSTEFNYYNGNFNPKILVDTGDLLFAWSGSRGTSFGPHFWKLRTGVLNLPHMESSAS